MAHSHKKLRTSLRTKVEQLERNLSSLEVRFSMLYGLLKEKDIVKEGEVKDFIRRQILTLKQKGQILETVTAKTEK